MDALDGHFWSATRLESQVTMVYKGVANRYQ